MTDLQVKLLKDKCDVTYQGGAVIWKWLQRAEGMILFTLMDGGRPVRRWGRGPKRNYKRLQVSISCSCSVRRWSRGPESNYKRYQPGVALSNRQIHPLFPHSTFSFIQLSLLSSQPLSPPPCNALLNLSNFLCLSPSPWSSTSSNFAFSDEKRPWNTWKFKFLSYHALVGQWERCQDQKAGVYTCVCMGVGKGARVLMHLCNGCLAGLPDLAEPFPCLPGSSGMQKPKDTLLPL